MQFVFNDRKAAQAAARLLDRHDGRMPYLKLIKLMYLADRQSLLESGYPITGDRLVAMDNGPVLSRVLDLIRKDDPATTSSWRTYISRPVEYEVSLVAGPESDELSDYELEVLDQVFDAFGSMDPWELVRYTHELPEWTDPRGSVVEIDGSVILREAGRSDEEIEAVAAQAEAARAFHEAYSG